MLNPHRFSQVRSRRVANDRGLVIEVSGFFNMGVQREFREAFESAPLMERYTVDLRYCAGIDSAGLGVLLLLRDFSQIGSPQLVIFNCPPAVEKVLRYSQFDQIFTIS